MSNMGKRGVTRPGAEKGMDKDMHNHSMSSENKDGDNPEHKGHKDGGHGKKMTREHREHMLHMHHSQTLWIYWMLLILGVWLLMSPLTFSYGKSIVEPGGGRSVWLSDQARVMTMTWSDIICGLLLIIFGWRSLKPNRPYALWVCCFIGIWLQIAPVLFWAPTAGAYINDTLVGVLIIAITVLIPGMPNMIMYMKMGGEVPKGWSYNPSSWPQRWIMIVTGFVGWMVSRYLGAFQLGYIDHVWDPFFGDASMRVLNSSMSHSWPVSDGALGAFAYTFEFLMGWMGSPSRWRTMPWMVTFFGILVIPLGLVHIFLVISQPLVVGEWCTFCILAAAIMLPMIPLEADEVIAMGQHMLRARKNKENLWQVFWKGGMSSDNSKDERSPRIMELPDKFGKVFNASVWGMSIPWTLGLATVIGIWIMFSPSVFGMSTQATPSDLTHLAGALIVVISVICWGEPLRSGRYLNILPGLGMAVAVWFMDAPVGLQLSSTVAGVLVAALSVPRGPKKESYGLWDKYVR